MLEKAYPKIHERVMMDTLANGLRVCVIPKEGFTKAYAQLSVHYGSIDARFDAGAGEIVPPKGVAHFLEHKVFEQPDGGNALAIFASTGASPNAFTSKTMTAYHFSCTDRFERNLEILLDFVSSPHFTDENVAKEQGIIGQEIGMVNDRPHFRVYENLMAALYSAHPAKDSIIGTVESIAQIDRHVLSDCYRVFYTPSNMVLTVAGDVDAARIIRTAESMLPSRYIAPPTRDYGAEPDEPAQREMEERMECSLPIVAAGFKLAAETEGEAGMRLRLIAALSCEVLFGESSPFYAEAYHDGLINQGFGAEPMFFPGSAAVMISGESRDPEEIVRRILAVSTKLDDAYFSRVKRAMFGARLRQFDYFSALCREVASAEFSGYHYFDSFAVFEKIEKSDIIEFASRLFVPQRMAVSKILPKS